MNETMMNDEIPNPLTDAGVKEDIRNRVEEILNSPLRIGTLDTLIRNSLVQAAEWGMREGFRMGWKVHETRSKRNKI